jgi:hypothetical protein
MKCEDFCTSVRSSRECVVDNVKVMVIRSLRRIEDTGKKLDTGQQDLFEDRTPKLAWTDRKKS